MKANYHTHTTFCDGKNTPEQIVQAAIEKGMDAIGFSGHGYTEFDLRYCMKDTEGYIREIKRLKEVYGNRIRIFLGVEEDAFWLQNRKDFDYIIGSCHYLLVDGVYHPVDSSHAHFKRCLDLFSYDAVRLAHAYYAPFCSYICRRKPDIVGHFDLVTKFDELETSLFLENPAYHAVAEQYLRAAAASGCLFEVNTGAISRGYRTAPYPCENLLHILKKNGNGLVLASDSHNADTLDYGFEEARRYLKELGFSHVYVLGSGGFEKDVL